MSANERLQGMQSALLERGVTDVKFCFSLGLPQMPSSDVIRSVSDFLEAYLNGRGKAMETLGDAPKNS